MTLSSFEVLPGSIGFTRAPPSPGNNLITGNSRSAATVEYSPLGSMIAR